MITFSKIVVGSHWFFLARHCKECWNCFQR